MPNSKLAQDVLSRISKKPKTLSKKEQAKITKKDANKARLKQELQQSFTTPLKVYEQYPEFMVGVDTLPPNEHCFLDEGSQDLKYIEMEETNPGGPQIDLKLENPSEIIHKYNPPMVVKSTYTESPLDEHLKRLISEIQIVTKLYLERGDYDMVIKLCGWAKEIQSIPTM